MWIFAIFKMYTNNILVTDLVLSMVVTGVMTSLNVNKEYSSTYNGSDNPLNLMNINSAYFDMEQLCSFLNTDMQDSTFDYTSLHLNIQGQFHKWV